MLLELLDRLSSETLFIIFNELLNSSEKSRDETYEELLLVVQSKLVSRLESDLTHTTNCAIL